jgi:hypothetical protein
MLQNENALLAIMTVVLVLLGAGVTIFIVLEIVDIVRGVYSSFRDDWRYSHSTVVAPDRKITPFRDQKTVERVIDHLEQDGGNPPSNQP